MDRKYEAVKTLEDEPIFAGKRQPWLYPGQRRQPLIDAVPSSKSSDLVFIKTAGNALQAVSRFTLEQKNLVQVTVPRNSEGGDEIHIRAPKSGKLVSVTIPQGCYYGHAFFVRFDDDSDSKTTAKEHKTAPVTVMGVEVLENTKDTASEVKATEVVYGHEAENSNSSAQQNAATPVASVIGIDDNTPSTK